jgi:hypothetical protein
MKRVENYKISIAQDTLDEILTNSKNIDEADYSIIKEIYGDYKKYTNSKKIFEKYIDTNFRLYKQYFNADNKLAWLSEPKITESYNFISNHNSGLPNRTTRFSECLSYIEKKTQKSYFPESLLKNLQLEDKLRRDQSDTLNDNNLIVFPFDRSHPMPDAKDGLNIFQPICNGASLKLTQLT